MNSVARETDHNDMNLAVNRGCDTLNESTNQTFIFLSALALLMPLWTEQSIQKPNSKTLGY